MTNCSLKVKIMAMPLILDRTWNWLKKIMVQRQLIVFKCFFVHIYIYLTEIVDFFFASVLWIPATNTTSF